jgi:transcriptional regulator with XRE-family HTH domain
MTNIELIKGSDLRLKLKRRGILSVDLCRAFGYNKTTVSRYFTDDMQMSATFVIRVAAYAGLQIKDLIEGQVDEPVLYRHPDNDVTSIAAEPQAEYINSKMISPNLHRITELYDMMEEIKEEIDKIRADMHQ